MRKSFLSSIIILSFIFVAGAFPVLAQDGGNNPGTGGAGNPPVKIELKNPFKPEIGNSLFSLLKAVINNILLPIGGVLAVLAFIYSGFLYVTAQGNETKLKKAHTALLYTAIGTALLLGAWVFANAICETIALISREPNLCPD